MLRWTSNIRQGTEDEQALSHNQEQRRPNHPTTIHHAPNNTNIFDRQDMIYLTAGTEANEMTMVTSLHFNLANDATNVQHAERLNTGMQSDMQQVQESIRHEVRMQALLQGPRCYVDASTEPDFPIP